MPLNPFLLQEELGHATVTIKDLTQRLKVSLSLAYRLVVQGEIPCYEIASCKRVSEEVLQTYLEQQKQEEMRLSTSPTRKRNG